jgi:hypothetical protein
MPPRLGTYQNKSGMGERGVIPTVAQTGTNMVHMPGTHHQIRSCVALERQKLFPLRFHNKYKYFNILSYDIL